MSEKNIENITKSDSNFTPTLLDCHSDTDFNGPCLLKTNISISEKVIDLYILAH